MITTTTDALAPALVRTAQDISVSSDGLSATVGSESLEADTPGKLAGKLSQTLYQLVHTGKDRADTTRPRSLRDPEFDRLLTEAMPHSHTLAEAVVRERTDDGMLVAELGGLRVLLPADTLVGEPPAKLPGAAAVRLPAARPALSTGFFLTDGSAGTGVGRGTQTLRVYVHVTSAEAAPRVWNAVLTYLEERRLVYRAKITSSPQLFPRRDALVVYLPPQSWSAVRGIGACVSGLDGVGPDTSPFAHQVVPGVAVAWEPQDSRPGMQGLSFGEHRSGALAQAMVKHRVRPDGIGLEDTMQEVFWDAGIDTLAPARNLASPPLPDLGLL
ncbi:T3SS effector HopA1 family protein (plasmid) [Streptomyces sp. NBC_01278]|uniref:T3SS effector HopA1 family protein n=1 Tax=Streptomyces sp. NBC_01278 TaxID=2903809 RepID=UPI002E3641F0|nr:T3SS effector HopA1 family protein [Streptomyces sp. NBC_01278]